MKQVGKHVENARKKVEARPYKLQEAAELILRAHPDSIAPLAARWIGPGERYGRVG